MHTMETVSKIQRLAHEEGKTYREIQEALGVSSKTVAKVLKRAEEFVTGYRRKEPVKRRALGGFEERIEELLKGKQWAPKFKGRRPRRTARWVYRRIKAEGYAGAESTDLAHILRIAFPHSTSPKGRQDVIGPWGSSGP